MNSSFNFSNQWGKQGRGGGIQRAYRERKKTNDPTYLERERAREASNRTPAALISKNKLTERRERNREYCKRYRQKKKQTDKHPTQQDDDRISDPKLSPKKQCDIVSSSTDNHNSAAQIRLIVRLQFNQRTPTNKRGHSP